MKIRILSVAIAVLVSGLLCALAQEARQVRVIGESVNLRTAPRMESEVVGQVVQGDVLDVLRADGNWIEVTPPTNVDLWVYGDLVQNGEVAVSRLVTRAGPGISYATVGRLEKGAKLEVRGAHGDWLKVAPPSGSAVWVCRQFVEDFVRPAAAVPVASASPAAETETVARVASAAQGPAATGQVSSATETEPPARRAVEVRAGMPPAERLVRTREQGRWVEVRGVVRRAGWLWRRPTSYCIVGQEISAGVPTQETTFYVWANDAELVQLAGRRMGIYGREYWIQGSRLPVIVPQRYFAMP